MHPLKCIKLHEIGGTVPGFAIINSDGALAEKLGNGLQNRVDGSVTRRCLQLSSAIAGGGCVKRKLLVDTTRVGLEYAYLPAYIKS